MEVLACRAFKGHQVFKDHKDHLESPEFKVTLDYFPKFKMFPFLKLFLDFFQGGMERMEKMVATESKEKMGKMVRMELRDLQVKHNHLNFKILAQKTLKNSEF